jgi:L-serine/L-threonine ammonia-lyase
MSTSALYRKTPCIQSADDASIFFKCEFLQPVFYFLFLFAPWYAAKIYSLIFQSGSFKDRGISHMIQTLNSGGNVTRLVCSSGGNAGHAVATAAQVLGLPADIFVPVSTLPMMVDKLRARGANVTVVGANWNEADSEARKFLSTDSSFAYIPPFDHELIWRGNSSIVDEIVSDFDVLPDTIVLSVGGGGLLRGIQLGLERFGLTKSVKIIAYDAFILCSLHHSFLTSRLRVVVSVVRLKVQPHLPQLNLLVMWFD